MSGRRGKGPGDYEVGYGRPPKDTQFQPGKSGNPRGRPRGARSSHRELLAHLQPTRDIILEEAYAPVKIRDGERKVQVAAIRAVTRATIKSAVTGGQMAQRTMLELTLRTEHAAAEMRREVFDVLYRQKRKGAAELARCRRQGLPEPRLLPHPDDIIIDWSTLTAEVHGPMLPEELEALEKVLAERDKYERGFAGLRAEARMRPRDWTLPALAKMAQDRFDCINELVPKRCRRPLAARMTEDEIEAAQARVRRQRARSRA